MYSKKHRRHAFVTALSALIVPAVIMVSSSTAISANGEPAQNRERIQARARVQDGNGSMDQLRHLERERNHVRGAQQSDVVVLRGDQDRTRGGDRDGEPDLDRIRDRLRLHLCWLLVHLTGGLGR